jgi:hypothetical protein
MPRPLGFGAYSSSALLHLRSLVLIGRAGAVGVKSELKKAEANGDTKQVSVALQMVRQLENVEYQKS